MFQRFEPDPKVVTVIDKAGRRDRPDLRNPRTSLEQRNGLALIVVTDDGFRVSDDDLVNLGQRGRRLDEQTPGHGLWLAIVREIVARYEGETSFSNGLKGGLKVLIEISIRCFSRRLGSSPELVSSLMHYGFEIQLLAAICSSRSPVLYAGTLTSSDALFTPKNHTDYVFFVMVGLGIGTDEFAFIELMPNVALDFGITGHLTSAYA